jgi:hypothetical protein
VEFAFLKRERIERRGDLETEERKKARKREIKERERERE